MPDSELSNEYRAWFEANLQSLEAIAVRSLVEPRLYALDEQDAVRFSTFSLRKRFDELAGEEYRKWLTTDTSYETFSSRLLGLHVGILNSALQLWRGGPDVLLRWYEALGQRDADSALTGRLKRWEHRARTTEILHGLSRDRGLALASLIKELDQLFAEEGREVPAPRERLQVWVHSPGHHFNGGYSGDFLERARGTISRVGVQLHPAAGIQPLEFCLQTLLSELVCEMDPLDHPQIARLNQDQRSRYVFAALCGDSITPESGLILNVCEALRWYCHRLIGLIGSPEVCNQAAPKPAKRRGRRRDQERRDAIHYAIAKHGDEWRDQLDEIFEELDGNEVPLGDFQAREIDLGDAKTTKAGKWTDLDLAQGEQRRLIVDALRKYVD